MNRMMTMVAGAILIGAGGALGGEPLSAEQVLPLHDGRDAYAPCAAFVPSSPGGSDAAGKGTYLVVWRSGLLAPGDLREGFKFDADIVGCRVSGSGEVLSKEPFVICRAGDLQDLPRMAAGKDCALVVWQDLRNGKDWDVYGAQIASDGKVLDADGFLISGGPHNQGKPRVAWDGKTFVAIWQNYTPGKGYGICAARISPDGKVLDPQGLPLCEGYDGAVASAGDGRSFVFCNRGFRFEPGGRWAGLGFLTDGKFEELMWPSAQRGQDPCQVGGANTPLFCAAGKGNFLVAWRGEHWIGRGQGDASSTAVMIDGKGKVVGPVLLAGCRHLVMHCDLVWDGSAFASAWTAYREEGMKGPDRGQLCGDAGGKFGTNVKPFERVLVSRILPDGKLAGPVQAVAGEWKSPASNVCVASDGAGATLIAYQKEPETGDVPIKIAFRLMRVGQ
jgi:hypothetical protein